MASKTYSVLLSSTNQHYLDVNISSTSNASSNSSSVSWSVAYRVAGSGSYYSYNTGNRLLVQLNGTTYVDSSNVCAIQIPSVGSKTIATGSFTVSHAANGTCSFPVYVYFDQTQRSGNDGTISETFYCDTIQRTYSLTFHPNGGTLKNPGSNLYNGSNTNSVPVTYGSSNYYAMEGDIPIRDGYEFKGWYTASSGGTQVYTNKGVCSNDGTYWKNNSWNYSGNLTVYAQWVQNVFVQTIMARYQDVNGNFGEYTTVYTGEYNSGDICSWSSDETVEYEASDISYTVTKTDTKYVDIYRKKYSIYFDANGGMFTPSSKSCFYGGTIQLPKYRPTMSGGKFLGWDLNPNATIATYSHKGNYIFDDSEPTLYAVWSRNQQENIYIYNTGDCYASEYIEDDVVSFGKNGVIYLTDFTEFAIQKDGVVEDLEYIEGNPLDLTDENGDILIDNENNYLWYVE